MMMYGVGLVACGISEECVDAWDWNRCCFLDEHHVLSFHQVNYKTVLDNKMLADSQDFARRLLTKNISGVFDVIYGWMFGWECSSLYEVRQRNRSHVPCYKERVVLEGW
jgi:hypothetical protein